MVISFQSKEKEDKKYFNVSNGSVMKRFYLNVQSIEDPKKDVFDLSFLQFIELQDLVCHDIPHVYLTKVI